MKQIFYGKRMVRSNRSMSKYIIGGFLVLLALFCVSACSSVPEKTEVREQQVFRITHADSAGRNHSEIWTRQKLESQGVREISSEYFDRAMHSKDSRFSTISFSRLLKKFALRRGEDSVLLNCFDDYQGILSIEDIYRYDLQLATRIQYSGAKPSWLNPLLILVPDGKRPPFQERFMTANVRELKFVRLNDYYAPLDKAAGFSIIAREGLMVFKDNCLFCHSLKGRGGNKGARLLEAYKFANESDQKRFIIDFKNFHHKDNADKQDLEQFVTQQRLDRVIDFLKKIKE
ncbi:MAG: hypothetical protein F3741_05955 [Nitrospinae bacterium]|nr:hypothetical protein [Nitrospinota bacterium]